MAPPINERQTRQARSRALATVVVDQPQRFERFDIPDEGTHRPSGRIRHAVWWKQAWSYWWGDVVSSWRKRLAMVLLVVQIAACLGFVFAPQFQIRTIHVIGLRYLKIANIVEAAAIPRTSVFLLDTGGVQQRLNAVPWIESSHVTVNFPDAVTIEVQEWPTVLRLVRNGQDFLVSTKGDIVKASAPAWSDYTAVPTVLDERSATSMTLSGKQLFNDAKLVQFLRATSLQFPTLFGSSVACFQWDQDGVLTLYSSAGWSAVFGHVDTQAALQNVPTQLADLIALKQTLNFMNPNFGYVNLENPAEVAVGGTPGIPLAVASELAAAAKGPTLAAKNSNSGQKVAPQSWFAQPTAGKTPAGAKTTPQATLAPTPKPTPTPAATPTPYQIVVP